MSKIAAVGRGDEMLAFSALGAEAVSVGGADEAREWILNAREFAVIFLSETLYGELAEFCEGFTEPYPAILPIPGLSGSDNAVKKPLERDALRVGIGRL